MIGDQNPAPDRTEHQLGCPQGRLETYPVRRPDGSAAKVTRCLDCAYHHVEPR